MDLFPFHSLVSGDVCGKFNTLFERVRNILKKNKDFEVNDFEGKYSGIRWQNLCDIWQLFAWWRLASIEGSQAVLRFWYVDPIGCWLSFLVSLCASKTNGLNPNRTWKQLTLPLSRILITSSPYCLPYNSYDVSSDNLVLDQLIIPFFRLVTSVRQRKNSESPWGIEPQTFRFHALMLYFATNIPDYVQAQKGKR